MIETVRNAQMEDLINTLLSQRARSLDVVVPGRNLACQGGNLVLPTGHEVMDDDGVSQTFGSYRPNTVANEGLSAKLDVPRAYLRRLHGGHADLYDANVGYWLARYDGSLLLRLLRRDGACERCLGTGEVQVGDFQAYVDWTPCPECHGTRGIVRAVLTNGYRIVDNVDVAMSVLRGLQECGYGSGGLQVDVEGDVTERRMYMRVTSPSISANAIDLVRNYRDPITGRRGTDYPLMWAGFVVSNSETGSGALTLQQRVVLQVCTNGQTIGKSLRTVHLGARLADGAITPSQETQRRNLALISSQTADAVREFMSPVAVQRAMNIISERADRPLPGNPAPIIERVAKELQFTDSQVGDIMAAFIGGGDLTAGGVMHAVTAAALQQPDGDVAADMESKALQALTLAATAA